MRGRKTMRGTRVVDVFHALDEACRFSRGVVHRHDLIILAVQDESGYIDRLQIFGEVGLRERFDAVVRILESALHAPQPELIEDALRDFRSGPVGAIKLNGEVLVELRAVLYETRAERIEHIQGQPLRILRSLYHEGGHRGDQYDFRHPFGSVATYVARNLATAGRVANERDFPQIERFDDGGKVISVAIHVVAGGGLLRSAVTSAVMRDHAEALLDEEKHLSVPRVRIQRPTVGEHDYRASAPVFEVDLRTVFAADRVHGLGSFRLRGERRLRFARSWSRPKVDGH